MTPQDTDRDRVADALAAEAEDGFTDDQIGDPPTPGRPPLPEGDARSEQMVVRVTPADKARLVWLADAMGEAQSDVARRALDDLFRKHGVKEDTEDGDQGSDAADGTDKQAHLIQDLVESKAFTKAVAAEVRRALDRREQPA